MPRCLSQHLHRGQVGPIPRSLAADSHVASADALSRRWSPVRPFIACNSQAPPMQLPGSPCARTMPYVRPESRFRRAPFRATSRVLA